MLICLSLITLQPTIYHHTQPANPNVTNKPLTLMIDLYIGDNDKDRNKDRYPPSTDNQVGNNYPPADGKIPYDRYPGAAKPDLSNGKSLPNRSSVVN